MAKTLTYELLPRTLVPDTYGMIGETHIDHFNERAEIVFYIFHSEDARRQRLAESEHELHRPIKKITVTTTIDTFNEYIKDAAKVLAAAGYKLITEVPEGSSAEPRGLKALMARADDH
jgi:hypothetical protein